MSAKENPAFDAGGCYSCGQRGAHLVECEWLNTQSPCERQLNGPIANAADLIGKVADHMSKHEREHNEDLFDWLHGIETQLREAARALEGNEWSWSPRQ